MSTPPDALAAAQQRRRERDAAQERRRSARNALLRGEGRERIEAAFALARLAPPGPELLPALVDALAHPEGDVRWTAARILVDLGRVHGEVLRVLLGLLASAERAPVRRMAAHCLRELAPDRPEAAHALVAATRDPDPAVRRGALVALAGVVDPPAEARTRLLACLEEAGDPQLVGLAALALGRLATSGGAPCPGELRERLRGLAREHPSPAVRRALGVALTDVNP